MSAYTRGDGKTFPPTESGPPPAGAPSADVDLEIQRARMERRFEEYRQSVAGELRRLRDELERSRRELGALRMETQPELDHLRARNQKLERELAAAAPADPVPVSPQPEIQRDELIRLRHLNSSLAVTLGEERQLRAQAEAALKNETEVLRDEIRELRAALEAPPNGVGE